MKANRMAWAGLVCLLAAAAVSCDTWSGASSAPSGTPSSAASPSSSASSSLSSSCAKGTFHWGKVSDSPKTIAVSQLVRVKAGKDSVKVAFRFARVRSVVAHVEASGEVSDKMVFRALEKRLDLDGVLLWHNGKAAPVPGKEEATFLGLEGKPRQFLDVHGVHVVEASFALDCAAGSGASAAPLYGSVTAWYGSDEAGLVCGNEPAKKRWFREAYDMVCAGARS
ncbi:hypothetical protein [Streptomyces sp. NBC_01615]|uniref:hypothetical protein n=1 Tax=Streptomyces sp. NBC_01615 TaxID=2975898 RepID=UPI00386F0346